MVDVVVDVGSWEHECCGSPVERNQLVDLACIRHEDPDGRIRLVESHHGFATDERIRGRVTEIQVVQDDGTARPIHRVPGGLALCGFDDADDGHLEDPWTGDVISSESRDFLVTVRTSR